MTASVRVTTIAWMRHRVSVVADLDFFHERLHRTFALFHHLPTRTAAAEGYFDVLAIDGMYVVRSEGRREITSGTRRGAYRELRRLVSRTLRGAHPEYLWLHAGAVARDGRALILPGAFGTGKSTLVAALCERGWAYLSDDVAPIDLQALKVLPYPLAPNRRVPADRIVSAEDLGKLHREKIILDATRLATGPLDIAAVIFPVFVHDGDPSLEPCAPSDAAVQLEKRRLGGSGEQPGDRGTLLRGLLDAVPSFRLRHPGDAAAAELLIDRFGI